MNINKVWFYIALLGVIIAGVWASLPDEAQRETMRAAVRKKQAQKRGKQAASAPASAAAASQAR